METVTSYLSSIQFDSIWKAALILLLGTLILSVFGRFVFGKRSALNHAVSSAIGILFIYAITLVLESSGLEYARFVAPLPFVSIADGQMVLFSFQGAHYTVICAELLNMVILSFLVNLADGWLPKGKNIFTWLLFRCLTVVLAYLMHLIVTGLLTAYLPEGIITFAPSILLGILVLLLLTGALKIVVGALLTTVNPIIGGLYTFFFATAIGKQITKAVLTTVILTAAVIGLQYAGLGVISIANIGAIVYVPCIVALVVLWYIIFKVF